MSDRSMSAATLVLSLVTLACLFAWPENRWLPASTSAAIVLVGVARAWRTGR